MEDPGARVVRHGMRLRLLATLVILAGCTAPRPAHLPALTTPNASAPEFPLRVWLPARDLTDPVGWYAPRVAPYGRYANGTWDAGDWICEGYPPLEITLRCDPPSLDTHIYSALCSVDGPRTLRSEETMAWIPFERRGHGAPQTRVEAREIVGTWVHFVRHDRVDEFEFFADGTARAGEYEIDWSVGPHYVRIWYAEARRSDGGEPFLMHLSPDAMSFVGKTEKGIQIGFVRADLAMRVLRSTEDR